MTRYLLELLNVFVYFMDSVDIAVLAKDVILNAVKDNIRMK